LFLRNPVNLGKKVEISLDEADKMLDLGLKMSWRISEVTSTNDKIFFSPPPLGKTLDLQQLVLDDPLVIEITEETDGLINQVAYMTASERKGPLLRYLIKERKR
jgi:ATP-dependent RNA helicase RhlE